ncbi:MAG: NADH-quinone oxidoreductase subunit C [Granulosicoccus sp.]
MSMCLVVRRQLRPFCTAFFNCRTKFVQPIRLPGERATMSTLTENVANMVERLSQAFPDNNSIAVSIDLVTMDVATDALLDVSLQLRDAPSFSFKQLTDLCGVDYATYGQSEWATGSEDTASFSRAVDSNSIGRLTFDTPAELPQRESARFVVVSHLLSIEHNVRLRLRCAAPDDELPVVPSLTDIWSCADWYEREAFDLFGILFDGHNDLRRILTDYGFTGHPFRKDFPLIGNVEMRYDPIKQRVVYEPVSIEPRVLVPRVIRDDGRYDTGVIDDSTDDKAVINNA